MFFWKKALAASSNNRIFIDSTLQYSFFCIRVSAAIAAWFGWELLALIVFPYY
jgi:hypothetical protein